MNNLLDDIRRIAPNASATNTLPKNTITKCKPKFLHNGIAIGHSFTHAETGRQFPVEVIDVLSGPYVPDRNNQTENKVVVNLGTYFKYVTSVNFYIDVNDYEEFVKEYGICDYLKLLTEHNARQTIRKMSDPDTTFHYELYALSKECPINKIKVICPVDFYRTNPCQDRFVFHTELDDSYNIELQNYYTSENMKLVRLLQQGNDLPLRCRRSNTIVENYRIDANGNIANMPIIFQMHHMLVKGRSSVRKIGPDPSKLIRSMIIKDNPEQFIDLLGTIALSELEHKAMHRWSDSDILFYTNDQLPWVLQSKENFDKIVKMYLAPHGIELDYNEFMYSQTLASL